MECSISPGSYSPLNLVPQVALQIQTGLVVLGVPVMELLLKGAVMFLTAVPGLDYVHGLVLVGGVVDVGWEGRSW